MVEQLLMVACILNRTNFKKIEQKLNYGEVSINEVIFLSIKFQSLSNMNKNQVMSLDLE